MGRRQIRAMMASAVFAIAMLAGIFGMGSADTRELTAVDASTPAAGEMTSSELRILSYNVEGLPWPVASGRAAAADRIASTLRALREQGRQPQVVALQEAFSAAAKRIGRNGGYSYAAYGPSTDDAG